MRTNLFFLLCLLIPLAGCATPIQHTTASGKAEITIRNVNKAEVSDTLSNKLFDVCPNIVKADDSQIICEAPIEDAMSKFLLHTDYDSRPIARLTFNFIKVKQGVRIVFDYAGISNPGSAFERRHDWNGSPDTLEAQKMLVDLKKYMESGKR